EPFDGREPAVVELGRMVGIIPTRDTVDLYHALAVDEVERRLVPKRVVDCLSRNVVLRIDHPLPPAMLVGIGTPITRPRTHSTPSARRLTATVILRAPMSVARALSSSGGPSGV